jgi:type IV pilus assembly protein PilA
MKTQQNSTGAFTLVEIMVVVVVIGLLAALAIPAFTKARQASREKTVTNNLRQIAAAAQQYLMENGVASVGYSDIVGNITDKYLVEISTVAQEDYTTLVIHGTDTQISISSASITVTYNL